MEGIDVDRHEDIFGHWQGIEGGAGEAGEMEG